MTDLSKDGARKKQRELVSKGARANRKVLTSGFKIVLVGIVIIIIACAGAGFGMIKGIIDGAPDISTINIQPKGFKTTVYDADGVTIDTTLSTINSNRIYVYYDEIPADVVNAFVAIEDERFWDHNGIDVRGIFRVAIRGITSGNFDQGASTLTQQLIKNQVFNVGLNETTFMDKLQRKFQEQYLAIELEKQYTKEQIAEYYLNTIYLGQGVHGIEAAAERYFNKKVGELTISEITVIAGITQNPYKYDPVLFPKQNAPRREDVLDKMLELGYIDQKTYDSCIRDDVYSRIEEVKVMREENAKVNTYYIDALMVSLKNEFMKMYGLTSREAYEEIYTGGYSVYSVQDDEIQKICDSVVSNSAYYPKNTKVALTYALSVVDKTGETKNYGTETLLYYYRSTTKNRKYNNIYPSEDLARAAASKYKEYVIQQTGGTVIDEKVSLSIQPQATFTVIDQKTGYVKAITSGRGEKTVNLGFNRATEGKRQPGSTFKVLAAFLPFLDTGGALASCFIDAPYAFENGTPVRNWYKTYRGASSIRSAIENSMNIIAVKCITAVTPDVAFDYLIDLGFTTLADGTPDRNGNTYSDKTQACALGGLSWGVTNLEITAAYAAIANGGVYTKPVFYSKVVDHGGQVVIDNTDPSKRQHRAMKDSTAYMLIEGMKDVVRSGTGTPARMSTGVTCAGKTGTTSNNYDLWFCGMTPYYCSSVWYGYDSNVDIGSTTNHKKMWKDINDQIAKLENQPRGGEIMEKPESVCKVTLCKISGCRPSGACPTITDWGAVGSLDDKGVCPGHGGGIDICMESHEIATSQCPVVQHFIIVIDPITGKKTIEGAPFPYTDAIFSSSCHIHPEIEGFTITTSAGAGGTISPTCTVEPGSSVTIFISPLSGYSIESVIVDGVNMGAIPSVTFNDVQADHTVSVTFIGGGGEVPTEQPPTEQPPTEQPPTEQPPTEAPTEAPTPPPAPDPQPEGRGPESATKIYASDVADKYNMKYFYKKAILSR